MKMNVKNYDEQDLVDLRYIARVISTRSASFVSAAIATLLNKMGFSPVTVGIDGTVYRQHPRFKNIMEEKIRCLVRPEIEVNNFEYKSECGVLFLVSPTGPECHRQLPWGQSK